MAISLDYGADTSFGAYNPDNYYRRGLRDMANDFRATGVIRGSESYGGEAYFQKGGTSPRYGRGAKSVIFEAAPNKRIPEPTSLNPETPYTRTSAENPLTKADKVRLWEMNEAGKYVSTYDNLTPWKHYGRAGLRIASEVAPPLMLADTAYEAYNTPNAEYAKRFELENPDSFVGGLGLRALGAASDLGNVLALGAPKRYLYEDGPKISVTDDLKEIVSNVKNKLFKEK